MPRLKKKNVEPIVLLLHEGGFQNAPFSSGFVRRQHCENFSGPDLVDVVNRLDPEVDVVVSAHTHAPYICNIERPARDQSASSFGRLITSIDLTMDGKTGEIVSAAADEQRGHADGCRRIRVRPTILAHYKAIVRSDRRTR